MVSNGESQGPKEAQEAEELEMKEFGISLDQIKNKSKTMKATRPQTHSFLLPA